MISKNIQELENIWNTLIKLWREENLEENPLSKKISQSIFEKETKLSKLIILFLNSNPKEAEELYKKAREIKEKNIGNFIYCRAGIHVSNVCRANCLCCPMRRDNFNKDLIRRASVEEIILSGKEAYKLGFKEIFIQGGEDIQIIPIVSEAIKQLKLLYKDINFILNLGSLSINEYELLLDSEAKKYVIKHEVATPELHNTLRQSPIEKRVEHMILAKKTGFEVGSGNILGVPSQTDKDLANDLIFLGRFNIHDMISCTPYTASEVLPEPYKSQPAGDWEKLKRFVAIMRILFPKAHIHAPSNVDSDKIKRNDKFKSGQAELIEVGADEVTVEFTPVRIAKEYGLYEKASDRHKINIEKAKMVASEINAKLKFDF